MRIQTKHILTEEAEPNLRSIMYDWSRDKMYDDLDAAKLEASNTYRRTEEFVSIQHTEVHDPNTGMSRLETTDGPPRTEPVYKDIYVHTIEIIEEHSFILINLKAKYHWANPDHPANQK